MLSPSLLSPQAWQDALEIVEYIGNDNPEAGLEDQEKPWQADQKSGPTIPSRADLCLVPEEVSTRGGPLGARRGVL